MKYLKTYIVIVLLIALSYAQSNEYSNGKAGSFLRIGLGARNQALGNSGVALKSTGSGFHYNPALIVFNSKGTFSTGYSFMSLDRKFNYLGVNWQLPPTAAVSLNWIHAGVDDIQGRSYSGIPDETYSTGEDAIVLSFGNQMNEKLAVGINIKYLRHSLLDITATGVGFDIGIFYQMLDNLSLGAQVKEITASYNWKTVDLFGKEGGNYIEKFPIVFRGGATYQFRNLLLVADVVNYDNETFFHGGVEYQYQDIAALRVGYDHNSLTVGCGLFYDFMWNTTTELNYAFVQEKYSEGHSHVFTWNFKL